MSPKNHAILSNAGVVVVSALFVFLVLQLPDERDAPGAPTLDLVAARKGPDDGLHTLLLQNPSATDWTNCELVLHERAPQFVPVGSLPAGVTTAVAIESWIDASRLRLRCTEGVASHQWVPLAP